MVSSVVKEEGCPFIVCMTYAFHTNDKLCFILDLMNGKRSSAPPESRHALFALPFQEAIFIIIYHNMEYFPRKKWNSTLRKLFLDWNICI